MTQSTPSEYTLSDVEDGFARVRNAEGRVIGSVSRDYHGSTRTGTRWAANSRLGGTIGHGATRAAAVTLLTEWLDAYTARLAKGRS